MERIFTFGFGQTDPLTGCELANRFVRVEAVTLESARQKMLTRFGNRGEHGAGNWAFDYESAEDAGVEMYKLVEIDFATGLVVGQRATARDEALAAMATADSDYQPGILVPDAVKLDAIGTDTLRRLVDERSMAYKGTR